MRRISTQRDRTHARDHFHGALHLIRCNSGNLVQRLRSCECESHGGKVAAVNLPNRRRLSGRRELAARGGHRPLHINRHQVLIGRGGELDTDLREALRRARRDEIDVLQRRNGIFDRLRDLRLDRVRICT